MAKLAAQYILSLGRTAHLYTRVFLQKRETNFFVTGVASKLLSDMREVVCFGKLRGRTRC